MPACSLAVAGRHFFSLRFVSFFENSQVFLATLVAPGAAVCFALVFAPKRMQVGGDGAQSKRLYIRLYTHEKDYPLWDDHPNIWNLDP